MSGRLLKMGMLSPYLICRKPDTASAQKQKLLITMSNFSMQFANFRTQMKNLGKEFYYGYV